MLCYVDNSKEITLKILESITSDDALKLTTLISKAAVSANPAERISSDTATTVINAILASVNVDDTPKKTFAESTADFAKIGANVVTGVVGETVKVVGGTINYVGEAIKSAIANHKDDSDGSDDSEK
jgi:hypothetical protein